VDRPSLFQDDDLALDQFSPKSGKETSPIPGQTVREIAESGGFPSRTASYPAKRQPMTYRTGRTATLSVKTTPSTLEAFYEIARSQGWKAGETFEQAVEALQKALV